MPTEPKYIDIARKVKKKRGFKYQEKVDRVWINFADESDFKQQWTEFCRNKDINASDFFRRCARKLIREEGNDDWSK